MKASEKLALGAAVGTGALALLSLARRAEASTTVSPAGPKSHLHGLENLRSRAPDIPAVSPAAPSPLVVPIPSGPRPSVPSQAPVPAWRRRTDDGGPLLFIPDDVEALARVITSEAGSSPLAERVAIGWVARNRARARRPPVSVARLVCSPCGKSAGNPRPFSTRMPATPQNRELAALILASPQSEDPTQGATSCFVPGLQDRLHAEGRPGHKLDARGIRYCWLRGLDYYGSVGRWDLFGPRGGPGARAVPRAWNLDGFSVCCYRDERAACKGIAVGTRVEA